MASKGYGYGLRHSIARRMWAVSVKDYRNLYCLRFLWGMWMRKEYIDGYSIRIGWGWKAMVFIIIRFNEKIGNIG